MGHVEEVANRLKGLRDALGLTVSEIASACGIAEDSYVKYESGEIDIPVSTIHKIAHTYGVEITALLFGEEPKMKSYFVTRKGTGVSVERRNWYKYQSLAAGFSNRVMEPFLVTVEPDAGCQDVHLSSHDGQEFNYVLQGRMLIEVNGKQLILEEGDSIYFDSEQPHGMMALDGEKVCFLAIIL